MPDDVKPGGERSCGRWRTASAGAATLGVDVKVAWLLDVRPPSAAAGCWRAPTRSGSAACRGTMPSEFLWRGRGTKIRRSGSWLLRAVLRPPRDDAGFASFFQQRFDALSCGTDPARVGLRASTSVLGGPDAAHPQIQSAQRRSRSDGARGVRGGRHGTATFSFDPIFLGTTAIIELHQERRARIAAAARSPSPRRPRVSAARRRLIAPDAVQSDTTSRRDHPVYDDTRRSDAFVRRLGELCDARRPADRLAATACRSSSGTSSWPRGDVVDRRRRAAGARRWRSTLTGRARGSDSERPRRRRARTGVSFWPDVPPLGWATFHVRHRAGRCGRRRWRIRLRHPTRTTSSTNSSASWSTVAGALTACAAQVRPRAPRRARKRRRALARRRRLVGDRPPARRRHVHRLEGAPARPFRGDCAHELDVERQARVDRARPRLLRTARHRPLWQRRIRDAHPRRARRPARRRRDDADQPREARALPGALPDDDRFRTSRRRDPVRFARGAARRRDSRSRTGSTGATSAAASRS